MKPRLKNPLFRQITVIGIGLLGGSLSRAIAQRGLARSVYGIYRRQRALTEARKLRLGHRPILGLRQAVLASSDLVILALPVRAIARVLKKIGPQLRPGTMVMDVGSTKRGIMKAARVLPSGIDFVGCHPMAGSEKRGPAFSREDLFEGALTFVIRAGPERARKKCILFWKRLGAHCVSVSPEDHDRIAARVSHLPHLVATALVQTLHPHHWMLRYGGTGLRDATRIAGSSPALWVGIVRSNRDFISSDLRAFKNEILKLSSYVDHPSESRLKTYLTQASRLRRSLGP